VIYLDSCLLVYLIEEHPERADRVRQAIAAHADEPFAVSPLVRMECLVKPLRDGDLALAKRYETALERFASLTLDDDVFGLATALRARFSLKTPDALHLACAQRHGCAALWTNDARLSTAAHGLAIDVFAKRPAGPRPGRD
jgi:predicted nucleic acid-binding protein